MHLLKFLEENNWDYSQLTAQFGISVKKYDDRVVLNYDQIASPKTNPIVMECRGIILDTNHNVICRPFDRFFNLGEAPDTQVSLNMENATAYEKVDGSLIKVYHFNGSWEIATRGTAFAESNVNGFPLNFRDLVLKALGTDEEGFQKNATENLNTHVTYLFEVTAMENRVVTRYDGYQLHYLGARVTSTGEHVRSAELGNAIRFGARQIKSYTFATKEAALQAVNELGGMQEGFVVWMGDQPIAKIKADAYVAIHHIRGEGLNPKRISELVLSGEEEEYLTYFSEDRVHIQPYVDAYIVLQQQIRDVWEANKNIESQKDFAIAVKGAPFSGALFTARRDNVCPVHCFNEMRTQAKVDILQKYVN